MIGSDGPGRAWGAELIGLGSRRLVLASRSPRRAALLGSLGIPFTVAEVEVDERLAPGEAPEAAARRLAEAKARAAGPVPNADFVLGADTLVEVDGAVLGKPEDDAEARSMLERLSGRTHRVMTGVALLRLADGAIFSGTEITEVRFAPLTEAELDALVDSGDARGKAGAYAIQSLAAPFVDGIEGDYANVVGLPLARLRRLFRDATAEGPGVVAGIWRKRAHGGPMDALDRAEIEAGQGLGGNADRGGRRQVTLIEAEVFEAVSRELGVPVDPAARRANVLLRGVRLAGSRGRVLALGPCRLRILGETRPCDVMDAAVPGLRNALTPAWRAGAFGEVLEGGILAVGDPVSWEDP